MRAICIFVRPILEYGCIIWNIRLNAISVKLSLYNYNAIY